MTSPDTNNLSALPNKQSFKRLCQSISALDAIICPEWQYRYYSYNNQWSANEEFCEMRDGTGNHMLILFSEEGIVINGFAHESKMNGWRMESVPQQRTLFQKLFGTSKAKNQISTQKIWPGVVDHLPKPFHEFVFGEPVRSIGTTFCIWSKNEYETWQLGNIDFPDDDYKDGSRDLLQLLDGNPVTYIRWAEAYYEEEFENRRLNAATVAAIYQHETITEVMVKSLNPDLEDLEKLKTDLNEVGIKYEL